TLDISPRYGSGIHIVECLASAQVSFRRVEDLVERAGEGPLGQLGHELPTGAGWQVERALPPRPRSVLRRRHRDQAAQVLHRRERTDDLIPVAVRPLALDDVLTEPRTERQDLAPRTLAPHIVLAVAGPPHTQHSFRVHEVVAVGDPVENCLRRGLEVPLETAQPWDLQRSSNPPLESKPQAGSVRAQHEDRTPTAGTLTT